ncbi:DUF2382 domain-containing protein [Microbacterium enclense]|uniref:Conserved domain-containing protein n=1 Tax=Microbacterium enclense TaxID=993073 RepID=A0A1G6GLV3_9MICO|nr:PRC and DUF2382 domain-containing protein [Microbacterium enclense]KSU56348.1 photosystem reaction center subunit H [Microbacterium enclense]SDB82988.1 conserved domain-containing protein [Microbacterium enclense]
MISENNIAALIGTDVYGTDDSKIGTVGEIYVDPDTGRPTWATVKTGFFGTSESFVPLNKAEDTGGSLRVPYSKGEVKDAPRIESGRELSEAEEDELYRHYDGAFDLDHSTNDTRTAPDVDETASNTGGAFESEGRDTSGPTTDDAMTRSEEKLRVGTERVQTGRARLRKYVVTEHETVTVPVTREEVRLEREPITDGNVDSALDGPDISEEEHEVVLTEERPVVEKETVPVERVRLGTETVEDTRTVDADIRKEEIELDGDPVRDTDRA